MRLKDLGNLSTVINEVKQLGSIYDLGKMSTDMLTKSFEKLTASEILARIATMGLTDAQKLEIIQQYAIDAANYNNVASIQVLSTAQTTATASTTGLSTAFKGLTASLLANPLFWGAVIVGGIYATVKAIDFFTESVEEARESANNAFEGLEESKSKLESINSEMETSGKRLRELEAQDSLSFIEQEELEKLKETTKELELQLSAQKALNDVANEKANTTANNYFGKSDTYERYTGYDMSGVELGNQRYGSADYDSFIGTPLKILEQQLVDYDNIIQRKKELDEQLTNLISSNPNNYESTDNYKNMQMELNAVSGQLGILKNDIPTAILEINKLDDTLIAGIDDDYIQFITRLNDSYNSLFDGGKNKQDKFDNVWNSSDFEKQKESLEALSKAGQLDASVLSAKEYSCVLDATGLSAEEVASHINAIVEESDKLDFSGKFDNKSMSDMVTLLDTISDKFVSIDKLYVSFKDSGNKNLSNDDLSSAIEAFKDIDGVNIDGFLDTLTNAGSTIEQVQEAFNNLTSEYINASGILDGVNESNANYVSTKLQEIGVTNSVVLVEAQLTVSRNEAALASVVMTNATYGELAALRDEIATTEEAKLAINQFYLEKITANGIALATNGDIQNIMSLVTACGSGISALQAFHNARQGLFASFNATLSTNNWKASTPIGQEDARKKLEAELDSYSKNQQKLLDDANKEIQSVINTKYSAGGNYGGTASNGGGSKSSGGGGKGSSGSGSGKQKEPTTIDWIDTLIERTNEKIEDLQNKINDATNWKSKNPLTDTAIDEMSNKLTAYQGMFDEYVAKANSTELSDLYKYKVQNGALEIEDISDENISNMVSEYKNWYDKAQSVKTEIDSVKESIRELNKSKLDNIIGDFDNLISLMDKLTSYNEKLISIRERTGKTIHEEDYTDLIAEQNAIYQNLSDEYENVEKQLNSLIRTGDIKKYSEDWYKYQETLVGIKSSMQECTESVLDFRDSIIDLRFDDLTKFADKMNHVNSGLSTMLNILGDGNKLEKGMLTTTGLSALAIYSQQLANAKQEASEYSEAISALTEMYDKGDISQDEYTKRLYEYQQAQWGAVEATNSARDAILQLKYEAIDQEIEAFRELVDAKKEELDAEKALYDHRKKVQDQSKNIATLEKKIKEYSLSDSREDLAMKLKLEEELAKAKEELNEYQYEHSLEQQKEALDKEADTFEESKSNELKELKSSLEKQDAVIKDYLSKVKDNYETVYKNLTTTGNAYNMTMTDDLTKPWASAESATEAFTSAVSNAISKINYDISNIDMTGLKDLVEMLNGFSGGTSGSGLFDDVTNQGKWQKNNTGYWYGNDENDYVSDGYYNIKDKTYGFNSNGYMITGWDDSQGNWHYFEPENGEMVKSSWRKSKDGSWYYLQSDGTMATNASIKSQDEDGYYIVDDSGEWDGELVKKPNFNQYPLAYAKGTKNVPYDTSAFINEYGEEIIARPTDDSMLVSLKAHDKVLKPDWSNNLFDLASDPDQYIIRSLNKMNIDNIPKISIPQHSGGNVSIGSLINVEGSMLSDVFEQIEPKLSKWAQQTLPQQIQRSTKKY